MRMMIPFDTACALRICVMVIVLIGLTTGSPQKNDHETFSGAEPDENRSTVINANSTKRHVFLPDDRRKVKRKLLTTFPYSANVAIFEKGFRVCSGSLISNQHVLTAAHCIRNTLPISSYMVGFLEKTKRFRFYTVSSVQTHLWSIKKTHPRYDYAVLTLSATHRRTYFGLSATISGSDPMIYFTSFPSDKKVKNMWSVNCRAMTVPYVLISKCDATKGSSGAGVYIKKTLPTNQIKRLIVGVLAGAARFRNDKLRLTQIFNYIKKFDSADVRRICGWAGSPTGCVS